MNKFALLACVKPLDGSFAIMSSQFPQRRKLIPPTWEEDQQIIRGASDDPDNPPLTDQELAQLRPAIEVAPGLVEKYRSLSESSRAAA